MIEVKHHKNHKGGEFEALINDAQVGLMSYTWAGTDQFIIDHTEVSPNHNGQGIGKEMVYSAVKFARERGVKIIPLCPFANATFKKNEEIRDVL